MITQNPGHILTVKIDQEWFLHVPRAKVVINSSEEFAHHNESLTLDDATVEFSQGCDQVLAGKARQKLGKTMIRSPCPVAGKAKNCSAFQRSTGWPKRKQGMTSRDKLQSGKRLLLIPDSSDSELQTFSIEWKAPGYLILYNIPWCTTEPRLATAVLDNSNDHEGQGWKLLQGHSYQHLKVPGNHRESAC